MPLPKQHEVDIWNRALARIGDNRISLGADVAVTSVTAAAPPLVTSAVHSLAVGDRILLFDQTVGDEFRGRVFRVGTVPLTTTVTLYREDGSTYTAATGGFLSKLPDTAIVRACFDAWPEVRDEIIRAHPWNSVVRRTRLARLQTAKTITGASAANPCVITAVAHGYSVGDLVLIDGIVGMTELNGRYFTVGTVPTADTFSLAGEDSSLYTAYSSAGTARKALQPLRNDFGYSYRYDAPEMCERVLELAEDPDISWEREGDEILCDLGITVPIRYAKRITDPALWDMQLVNVLSARLAYEIAEELSASAGKRDRAKEDWLSGMDEAKRTDSQEQSSQELPEDEWVLAHGASSSIPWPKVTPRGTR